MSANPQQQCVPQIPASTGAAGGPTLQTQWSGTGGGGGPLEPRIAKLESDVANIKVTLDDLKGLTGKMLWSGIAAVGLLLAAYGGGYVKLTDRMDGQFEKVQGRFEKVEGRFEKVDQRFARVDAKLDSMKEDIHRLELNTQRIEMNVQRIADSLSRQPASPPSKK